jgi:hypothetical protein
MSFGYLSQPHGHYNIKEQGSQEENDFYFLPDFPSPQG